MSLRISNRRLNAMSGFTLIELVLAMSIFSLILLMAYQALASSAQAKLRVSEAVNKQSELRSAYRTLSNAFGSRAQLKGDKHSIELDLSTADSRWLEGAERIKFLISNDQALWAYVGTNGQESILFNHLEQAEFRYFEGGLSYSSWVRVARPSSIELSWNEGGDLRRWRFDTR